MKNSIGFIGIGQAGGNISSLFEKCGYSVLYVNTSKEDLDTLREVKHTYHIKNGEGCNKDRDKAKDLMVEDFEAIVQHVEEKLSTEFIFVIFSSGGGTGSGASPMLIDLLIQHTKKKVGAITILPATTEPLKAYINSYECFAELERIDNMCATFVLDNNKGDKLLINKTAVELFNAFVDIPSHTDVRGNIDRAEIKEMLSTRGAAIISKMSKNTSSTHKLLKLLHENIFAPIESNRVVKYIGISTTGSIDIGEIIKETGKCLDIFRGSNSSYTVCMICGLTYPYTALTKIKDGVEAEKDNINKSLTATKTSMLSDGINFLAGSPSNQNNTATTKTVTDKASILAKYKRK